jgi:hypothetical protein
MLIVFSRLLRTEASHVLHEMNCVKEEEKTILYPPYHCHPYFYETNASQRNVIDASHACLQRLTTCSIPSPALLSPPQPSGKGKASSKRVKHDQIKFD